MLSLLYFLISFSRSEPMCHYTYGIWNIHEKKIVRRVQVKKLRNQLSKDEIGFLGCTPCLEDQTTIIISNGLSVQLCKKIAIPVKEALERALEQDAVIESIQGYRTSMSRGSLDAQGNRTQLSNHAFGTAIDINRENNGLYDHCMELGPHCHLIQGGPWNPQNPLSLTPTHPVVIAFKEVGFRWGGEIQGKQKDLMHFSPTGY